MVYVKHNCVCSSTFVCIIVSFLYALNEYKSQYGMLNCKDYIWKASIVGWSVPFN